MKKVKNCKFSLIYKEDVNIEWLFVEVALGIQKEEDKENC